MGLYGVVFAELELWIDGVERDGCCNMAVDDWLLETAERPVLRVYAWEPGWGSLGYFVPLADATGLLPDLNFVRRRTGGGIVDHRSGLTYSLVVPADHAMAVQRGGESYRLIHQAVAAALESTATTVQLSSEGKIARGGDCFAQPVEHDLVDGLGIKIAGAGQRRSVDGLLHQGSVAAAPDEEFGERLAGCLSHSVGGFTGRLERCELEARARRFGDRAWLTRR